MIPTVSSMNRQAGPVAIVVFYRRFILFLIYTGIITCCSFCSSSVKKEPAPVRDSTLIVLPPPSTISPFELNNLKAACDTWFNNVLEKGGFNGTVLVAKAGNIIFQRSKGMGHVGSTDTIVSTTAFHIASVTKTITAMAVLKLWQDGKLNIDDAFNKYFPAFNYPGVTIRSLLNHRSGLPNYLYFMEDMGWDTQQYIKNQDIFDYLVTFKDKLDVGAADRRFNYCNTNYALLALLIEKVSAVSFPQYVKKEFFTPLNMSHSFVFTLEDSARVNPSYDWRGQMITLNYLDLVYGDKNIYSTAEDLLIWDRALRSNVLFNEQTLLQAYTPYSNEKPGMRNYGLGWRMNVYPNGKKMIYHNGWWHGYNASFIRLIEEDATIIVMGNRYTRAVYKAKALCPVFGAHYVTGDDEEGETVKSNAISASPAPAKKNRAGSKKRKRAR